MISKIKPIASTTTQTPPRQANDTMKEIPNPPETTNEVPETPVSSVVKESSANELPIQENQATNENISSDALAVSLKSTPNITSKDEPNMPEAVTNISVKQIEVSSINVKAVRGVSKLEKKGKCKFCKAFSLKKVLSNH